MFKVTTRMVILLVTAVLVSLQLSYSPVVGQVVYYVTPVETSLNDPNCPDQPCLTLNHYKKLSNMYFAPGMEVIMYFQPGTHIFTEHLRISNINSITMYGNGRSLIDTQPPSLFCESHGSIEFAAVSLLQITNVNIISCGSTNNSFYLSALSLFLVRNATFTNCSFISNTVEGALYSFDSTITFVANNRFIDNDAAEGGAIYAALSEITLEGTSEFYNNSAFSGGAISICSCTLTVGGISYFKENTAAARGGAITVNDGVTCSTPPRSAVSITGYSEFVGNSAFQTGGVSAIFDSALTTEGHCTFEGNSAIIEGGAFYANNGDLSFGGSNKFFNNHCNYTFNGGGAISIDNGNLAFSGTTAFQDNSAFNYGGAIAVLKSRAVFFDITSFARNAVQEHEYVGTQWGGGISAFTSKLYFLGSVEFINNTAGLGGGIMLVNSNVSFHDSCVFTGNSASREGGGMFIARGDNTWLYLRNEADITFTNNTAEKGGAISLVDFNGFSRCSQWWVLLGAGTCFFKLEYLIYPKVQLHFINNSAVIAGSVLYGALLDLCVFPGISTSHTSTDIFKNISEIIKPSNSTPPLSSDPFKVCFCFNQQPNCLYLESSVSVRRGQLFTVSLAAVGEENTIVPATIRANFPKETGRDAQLGEGQAIQESGTACTNLQYSVTSPRNFETIIVYPQGPCRDISGWSEVEIEFLPCPDGFQLSYSECICERKLQKFTNSCNVNDEMILRTGSFWVRPEYDNETYKGLTIHPHCPFDYCQTEPVSIRLNDTDTQCALGHSGTLCGGCRAGLSLALGSSQCLSCSNTFIVLFLCFVVAGIVLVCLLLSLKLTVSVGTINGLIFYANIVSVNKAIFFPPDDKSVLSVFIAWLNLDLGIETCLYDGLDAYVKMWLQFVFPAYLWLLVGLMLVGSYYSTLLGRLLGRNPVAVLATLFLLSYAKILRTITAIFSFTFLEYPDGTKTPVWLYDGNVSITEPRYIPLLLTAIVTLLFLFLPYTLVLLLSQWIQAKSELRIFQWISSPKLKPFLDAYHAPYKNEYRYWTGMLLLLRCALFLVFAFNTLGDPSVNLLVITAAMLMLAAITRFTTMVYRNPYLDLLDVSFLLNLGLLAAATYHVRSAGGSQTGVAYTSVSVAVVTFVGIAAYHTYLQLKDKDVTKRVFRMTVQWRHSAHGREHAATKSTEGAAHDVNSTAGARKAVPVTVTVVEITPRHTRPSQELSTEL